MQSVVSKNLYELLGNDPELDPNREPEPPTKVIDKPVQRSGKRVPGAEPVREAPAATAGGRGGRRDNFTGSEQAIRDKNAGSSNNRSKPVDDGVRQDRHSNRTRGEGEGRGRGSRGGRGGRGGARGPRDDRHDRSGVSGPNDHEKQAAHGWGAETGNAEWDDEKAAAADAKAEEKDGIIADSSVPVDADGVAADKIPEEEDNTKSYEQYLAEQLEKKAALSAGSLEIRKPNEGSSKKFPEGKAFARDETEENFIAGSGGKAKRERERKTKQTLDIDQAWKEEATPSADRGASRGGRGRGEGRPRGDGARGRGEGRGRGGRGRGEGRGEARGAPRGGAPRAARGGPSPNLTSSSDFPSLGA
ncbi:hypothetical protein MBLNU459_g3623t1 [Dothideomycetes sp. NU459]